MPLSYLIAASRLFGREAAQLYTKSNFPALHIILHQLKRSVFHHDGKYYPGAAPNPHQLPLCYDRRTMRRGASTMYKANTHLVPCKGNPGVSGGPRYSYSAVLRGGLYPPSDETSGVTAPLPLAARRTPVKGPDGGRERREPPRCHIY